MSTTPITKGRPPLIPIQDNGRAFGSPLASKIAKAPRGIGPTPPKRGREDTERRSPIKSFSRNQGCNYETSTAQDDRDDQGNSKRKKQKGANSKKRVSFGGNSVKIITEHGNGRSTLAKPENPPSPILMDQLRTPPLLRRNPALLSGVNDDSDMDTLSATRPPSRISDSPSRFTHPRSPLRSSIRSPAQNFSQAERVRDRQSFGLFYDEDITIAVRGKKIETPEEDITQPLRSVGPSPIRRPSEPEDGDITYTLGYGYHDLMNGARDDQPVNNVNQGLKSPSRVNAVPEQRNLLEDYGNDDSGPLPRMDHITAIEADRSRALEDGAEEIEEDFEIHRSVYSPNDPQASEARLFENPCSEENPEDGLMDNQVLGKDNIETSKGLISSEGIRSETELKSAPPLNEIEADITAEIVSKAPQPTESPRVESKQQENVRNSSFESPEIPPVTFEKSDSMNQPTSAKHEGKKVSDTASSPPQPSGISLEVPDSQNLSLDELLRRLDVRFDNSTRTPYREASMAPTDSIPPRFDPNSSQFAIYECGKQLYYMERLRMEKDRLREEIASVSEAIKSLEGEINMVQPPMVQMLGDYMDQSSKRGMEFQCSVKRLRKACAFEAKEKWVDSRKVWEAAITEQLTSCADVLERDNTACESHLAHIHDLCSKLTVAGEPQGPERRVQDQEKGQRLLIRDMSLFKDMHDFNATLDIERCSLLKKLAVLEPMEIRLSKERNERKQMESSTQALSKRISDMCDEFSTIAAVTGVRMTEISTNLISLTLCGIAELNFMLHEDRIINTTCKPVKLFGGGNKAEFQTLINDSVRILSSAASVKSIKLVCEIPPMLRKFAYTLMKTQYFLEEACRYYMKHMGTFISSTVVEVDGNARQRVLASGMFYSMNLRSHFDVVISWTVYPTENGQNTHQEVEIEEIRREIGQRPDDETIRAGIQKGVRTELFSIYDSFRAVWELL
eukprot:TRINITY_DN514_c0_g1_i1.p1 TRINITY_DN514_c0_g1~~TRINITY_DN514_c0_g1_i1.p1  ORF type:complete len:960 (+),score=146.69 TRINITY_DN514_c0_g1_i1:151-3030(+)